MLAIWILSEDQPRGDFTTSLLRRSRSPLARLATQPTAIRAKLTVIHATRLPGFTETVGASLRKRFATRLPKLLTPPHHQPGRLLHVIPRHGWIKRGTSPRGGPRRGGGATGAASQPRDGQDELLPCRRLGIRVSPGGRSPHSPLTLYAQLSAARSAGAGGTRRCVRRTDAVSDIAVTSGVQVSQDPKCGILFLAVRERRTLDVARRGRHTAQLNKPIDSALSV